MEAQPSSQEVLSTPRADRIERQRRVVIAVTLGALAGAAGFANVRHVMAPGDLAKDKPWRISSRLADCEPAKKSCASAVTAILFHTTEEDEPWFEIDLLRSTRFSSLSIANRTDCCPERAHPLIVEVSDDQKTWREVARSAAVFTVWNPSFAPQEARYVRLRVANRSQLHLERVEVHR